MLHFECWVVTENEQLAFCCTHIYCMVGEELEYTVAVLWEG